MAHPVRRRRHGLAVRIRRHLFPDPPANRIRTPTPPLRRHPRRLLHPRLQRQTLHGRRRAPRHDETRRRTRRAAVRIQPRHRKPNRRLALRKPLPHHRLRRRPAFPLRWQHRQTRRPATGKPAHRRPNRRRCRPSERHAPIRKLPQLRLARTLGGRIGQQHPLPELRQRPGSRRRHSRTHRSRRHARRPAKSTYPARRQQGQTARPQLHRHRRGT